MLTSLLLALAAAQPIPFDAARWTLVGHGATSMVYLERPSLFIDNRVALLRASSVGGRSPAVGPRRTRRPEHGVPRTSIPLHRQWRGVAARLVVRRRHDRVRRGPARARQLRRCRVPRALRGRLRTDLPAAPPLAAARRAAVHAHL